MLFAGAAVIAQIFAALVYGDTRDLLIVGSAALFCAASIAHATLTRGWSTAVALTAVFAVGGLLVHVVGLSTGLPFGSLSYGAGLGPALFGVPVAVGLFWTMTAWPCWIAAGRLTSRRRNRVALAAWGLAAWDLFLGPWMVGAGYWRWTSPEPGLPGVYGVPLTSLLGWLVVALALMTVFAALVPERLVPPALDAVPIGLLGWVYFSSIVGDVVFYRLPYAALWGAAGMAVIALPAVAGRGGRAYREGEGD